MTKQAGLAHFRLCQPPQSVLHDMRYHNAQQEKTEHKPRNQQHIHGERPPPHMGGSRLMLEMQLRQLKLLQPAGEVREHRRVALHLLGHDDALGHAGGADNGAGDLVRPPPLNLGVPVGAKVGDGQRRLHGRCVEIGIRHGGQSFSPTTPKPQDGQWFQMRERANEKP